MSCAYCRRDPDTLEWWCSERRMWIDRCPYAPDYSDRENENEEDDEELKDLLLELEGSFEQQVKIVVLRKDRKEIVK